MTQCDLESQLFSERKSGWETHCPELDVCLCGLSPWDCQATPGRGALPLLRLAKVRVRPVTGLERGGEIRASLGTVLPLPSPSLWHLFPFRSWAGAPRQGNKSNFPPSHCHLLGFHTLGVSAGREPLPFSQCLWCAPSGPPGPGILFAA